MIPSSLGGRTIEDIFNFVKANRGKAFPDCNDEAIIVELIASHACGGLVFTENGHGIDGMMSAFLYHDKKVVILHNVILLPTAPREVYYVEYLHRCPGYRILARRHGKVEDITNILVGTYGRLT